MRPSDPDAKTYSYVGAEAKRIDGGWESLGDMGSIDADGYLYLADRQTDMILAGGSNVYPAEVEAALDEHPRVRSSRGDRPARRRSRQPHPRDRADRRRHADRRRRAPRAPRRAARALQDPARLRVHDEPLRDDAGKIRRSALREPARLPSDLEHVLVSARSHLEDRMATVDFDAFDADNHYYEATDAFTRHLPAEHAEARAVGRDRRQAADDRRQQDLPLHPEPHVRSGRAARAASTTTSAARSPGDDIRAAFGELEPINPAYREPDARVELMDTQRLAGLLPVPDARRRRRRGAAARPRRAARGVPRVQRVDARRLDVQLPATASSRRRTSALQDPARAEAGGRVRARARARASS